MVRIFDNLDVLTVPNAAKRISVPLEASGLKYINDVIDTSALRQLIESTKKSAQYDEGSDHHINIKVLNIYTDSG